MSLEQLPGRPSGNARGITEAIPNLTLALNELLEGTLKSGHRIEIDCNVKFNGSIKGNSKPSTLARQFLKYHLGRLDGAPATQIPFANEIEVSICDGVLSIYRSPSIATVP